MGTDALKKWDTEKFFREMEIPQELLESILLIPAIREPCPFAPTIKISRKLSHDQTKEMMAYEEEFGMDVDTTIEMPTFKETLIKKDLVLLAEIVATSYYLKIRQRKIDWPDLYQIVEIDWSFRDFRPGEGAIHYEVFTKRQIYGISEGYEFIEAIEKGTNG
jgi:hypothetical protein